MSLEDSLRSLSLDYLNLLINGQAFSDVVFSVEGRLVHAHRCILAARSLFFRKFFCGPDPPSGLDPSGNRVNSSSSTRSGVIPVNSVGYEVFLLMLQFLYSGQVSIVPQKHEPRPNCGDRGCWHTHCTSAVDLALDTLAAARYFGVEQLALLTQVLFSVKSELKSFFINYFTTVSNRISTRYFCIIVFGNNNDSMSVGEKKSKLSASSINLTSSVSVICVTSHMFCGSWEFPQLQVFGKWEFLFLLNG
jgi:hypothetical protein